MSTPMTNCPGKRTSSETARPHHSAPHDQIHVKHEVKHMNTQGKGHQKPTLDETRRNRSDRSWLEKSSTANWLMHSATNRPKRYWRTCCSWNCCRHMPCNKNANGHRQEHMQERPTAQNTAQCVHRTQLAKAMKLMNTPRSISEPQKETNESTSKDMLVCPSSCNLNAKPKLLQMLPSLKLH